MAKKALAKKIAECLKARESGKASYKRADELMSEIAGELKPGEPLLLGDGRKAVLVDNFAGAKDVLWGHGPVRRWELEVIGA